MKKEKFTKGPWMVTEKKYRAPYYGCHAEYRTFVMGSGGVKIGRFDDRISKDDARLIESAPEMFELLGRVEDYFQNRHIYGYGVEESVSADLLSEIKKVRRKLEGEICEKE